MLHVFITLAPSTAMTDGNISVEWSEKPTGQLNIELFFIKFRFSWSIFVG